MGGIFSRAEPADKAAETAQKGMPSRMSEKSRPVQIQAYKDCIADHVTPQMIQSLIQARADDITAGWESMDSARIGSWFSNYLLLHSIDANEFYKSKTDVLTGYNSDFSGLNRVVVPETQVFGNAFFTSKENYVEMYQKSGDIGYMRETCLAWWRWEGPGVWSGDMSLTETGIKGWKIFQQHDYEYFPDPGTAGTWVRILNVPKFPN